MATIFGIQFGSKFVSTKKYEAILNKERNDFERFTNFEKSELLNRYNALDTMIHSGEFEKKVRDLKNARYKDTEQWRQLDQYRTMAGATDIKSYLKFTKAGKLDRMKHILASSTYKEFEDLKKFVNSPAHHSAKAQKDYKQSDAYAKEQRYKSLLKDSDIQFYLKTEKSSEYRTIQKLENSERLQTFFKLEAIVESPEFIEHKAFMEDKKRFKKSEEAQLIHEFESLKKNEEIIWYLDKKKNNPFKEIRKWALNFEEDFDGLRLNQDKWMTGYYWGKALMNETYALAGEKQLFKDDNIEMRDSIARITTRREPVKGKQWDPQHGFTVREFEYTSGLISTGQSFRQKHGKFEAKVRFSECSPVINAFWMVGEKMTPQIDIFKTTNTKGKTLECGVHLTDEKGEVQQKISRITGAKFKDKFFIYSLEWSEEAIIWKINGLEVHRETRLIPAEPMYLVFCTTLPENPAENQLPANLEIDWIRCYSKKEE